MGGYRLYFMDRFSGHIDNRREFFADSDAEALAMAQRWQDGSPTELWCGDRKLKHWEPDPLAHSREASSASE